MKKKLFYYVSICFFLLMGGQGIAQGASLTPAQRDEIAKIQAHNKAQIQNQKFLRAYQKETSDKITPKDDGYWEMAFHAKLADYGDKDSQYIIAKAYEEGKYTAQNLRKALAFYKKSAEQGHIDSAMRLGQIYQANEWLQRDDEKALYYYLKAAGNGYAPAQMKVAQMYELNQEYQQAFDWLSKAVRQMYPTEPDLISKSPDLERLKAKIDKMLSDESQNKDKTQAVETLTPPVVAQEKPVEKIYQNEKVLITIYDEVLPQSVVNQPHLQSDVEVPYEG